MSSETHDQQPEELRIIGKKYIGRWISALIVLLILLAMGNSMLSNPRFEWSVIAENFTGPSIIQGVLMTLQLTAISVIFGFAGGTILALMRLSSNPVLVAVSWGYTWFFRGVPMLVQLFLWYNIAALYPTISISLPWVGEIWSASANSLISPFSHASVCLCRRDYPRRDPERRHRASRGCTCSGLSPDTNIPPHDFAAGDARHSAAGRE